MLRKCHSLLQSLSLSFEHVDPCDKSSLAAAAAYVLVMRVEMRRAADDARTPSSQLQQSNFLNLTLLLGRQIKDSLKKQQQQQHSHIERSWSELKIEFYSLYCCHFTSFQLQFSVV
jgi:hypothetical protein